MTTSKADMPVTRKRKATTVNILKEAINFPALYKPNLGVVGKRLSTAADAYLFPFPIFFI